MTEQLKPPKDGVTVRMYRQGHGDCFLLAVPRSSREEDQETPIYVLVDCGLKPGSQEFVHGRKVEEVVEHIAASTGNHLDLIVVTHEHQDHVNGFSPAFTGFEIGEAWLAWTEDPNDPVANELRRRHRDTLLGLIEARRQLVAKVGVDEPTVGRLDGILSLEIGDEVGGEVAPVLAAAAADPAKSANKQALRRIKEQARKQRGVSFLRPGESYRIEGTDVQAYVLGPPHVAELLNDENPRAEEAFPDPVHELSFGAAIQPGRLDASSPFAERFRVAVETSSSGSGKSAPLPFFEDRYGSGNLGTENRNLAEVRANAPWRRIDDEWLYSAESLALKLNQGINNTSLVLALELSQTKKVLLFVGDAQRGNWVSWKDLSWETVDGRRVTARDLLARTVLYKVGHHGSHNATLAGTQEDAHPNLSWMAKGHYAGEFTAMITAVNEWAMSKNRPPWRHPLPAIKAALREKAHGRVFQTDTDKPTRPPEVAEEDWRDFLARCVFEDLYFDYVVLDD